MSLQERTVAELREMMITYLGDHTKAMIEHDHVMFDKSKSLFDSVVEEMQARGYEVII